MYIDPKSIIAGWPVLKIRKLLHRLGIDPWGIDRACQYLHISKREMNRLLKILLKEGYIEVYSYSKKKQLWRNTLKGNSLALASAAKAVTRATADQKVKEFLERVHRVNEDDYFLYRVIKVYVFGSYLTKRKRINDVDLAVELRPRYAEEYLQSACEWQRRNEAKDKGRRFRNTRDMFSWPKKEVLMFLKSKSRTISLHQTDDDILLVVRRKRIFYHPYF